jgi:hypothetical protein
MEMISDEQDYFDFSAVAQEGQMNSSLRHMIKRFVLLFDCCPCAGKKLHVVSFVHDLSMMRYLMPG